MIPYCFVYGPHNGNDGNWFLLQNIFHLLARFYIFLDGTSDNMASLVQYDKYGAMNTIDTPTMVYYLIMFLSEAYTLQEDTTCDGQISSAG